MNYASDIQAELLLLDDLNEYFKGYVVKHAITQEFIAHSVSPGSSSRFWVRENANANAEVDMTYKWRNLLLPVEVKSGARVSLRSLHEYMELTPTASPFGSTATRFPAPPSRLSNSSCSTCRISLARS